MPILDTAVLFAAADRSDKYHKDAAGRLAAAGPRVLLSAAGLVEFDLVLRGRGYSPRNRREEVRSMMAEFPEVEAAMSTIVPRTLYLAAAIEEGYRLDYFDSLIAAEALTFDGKLVSSDRDFDAIPGLERIPLREGS